MGKDQTFLNNQLRYLILVPVTIMDNTTPIVIPYFSLKTFPLGVILVGRFVKKDERPLFLVTESSIGKYFSVTVSAKNF
jgi:hypothetical protein